jgi:hypothetical protein
MTLIPPCRTQAFSSCRAGLQEAPSCGLAAPAGSPHASSSSQRNADGQEPSHCSPLALQGVLKMGQEVEVRPGIVTKDAEGRAACLPIYSRIVSLKAEDNSLQYAVPGGLIGVGMTVRFLAFRGDDGPGATASGRQEGSRWHMTLNRCWHQHGRGKAPGARCIVPWCSPPSGRHRHRTAGALTLKSPARFQCVLNPEICHVFLKEFSQM